MVPESISEIAGLPVNTVPILFAIAAAAFVTIRDDKRADKQHKLEAEISINEAYIKTHAYYEKLKSGVSKDIDEEHEISMLWRVASTKIRDFDSRLANRFGIKSSFWKNGAAWTQQQIQLANIGLEAVRREGSIVCRK